MHTIYKSGTESDHPGWNVWFVDATGQWWLTTGQFYADEAAAAAYASFLNGGAHAPGPSGV